MVHVVGSPFLTTFVALCVGFSEKVQGTRALGGIARPPHALFSATLSGELVFEAVWWILLYLPRPRGGILFNKTDRNRTLQHL